MITLVPVMLRPDTPIVAVRWNAPNAEGRVLDAHECEDHPSVKPTYYMEVSQGLNTSGCSQGEPWWSHSVMGVIHSSKGKIFVSPGDWVISFGEGQYLVLSDDHYNEFFRSAV